MLSKKVFKYYRIFRTTAMVDEDLKALRKINNLISKYTNSGNDRYRFEAVNIIKTFANLTNFEDSLTEIIKEKIINDDKYIMFDLFLKEAGNGQPIEPIF